MKSSPNINVILDMYCSETVSIISISTDCLFFLFNSHRRSVCEFFSSSGIFLVSVHQKYLKAHKIVAEFTYSVY